MAVKPIEKQTVGVWDVAYYSDRVHFFNMTTGRRCTGFIDDVSNLVWDWQANCTRGWFKYAKLPTVKGVKYHG